jgi:hypothetical protein
MALNYSLEDSEIRTWVRHCLPSEQICTVKNGLSKHKSETIEDLFFVAEERHLTLVLAKLQLYLTKVYDFELLAKKIVNHLSVGFKISTAEVEAKMEHFTEEQRTSNHLLCPTECNFCKKISFMSEVTGTPINKEMKHLMNYYKVHGDLTMLQRSLLLPKLIPVFKCPEILSQPVTDLQPPSPPDDDVSEDHPHDDSCNKRDLSDDEEFEDDDRDVKRLKSFGHEQEIWRPGPEESLFSTTEEEAVPYVGNMFTPTTPNDIDVPSRSSTPDYSSMMLPAPVVKTCSRMKFDSSKFPTGEATMF